MSVKSSVSGLNEFCAKKRIHAPTYEWVMSSGSGFICKVYVMDLQAYGNGRSKRLAKHVSAINILKQIQLSYPEIDEIVPLTAFQKLPVTDRVMALRNFCIKYKHPLPTIEIVQESGTRDAPQFTALCTFSSLYRYGKSGNKKDARQKAADEMLSFIMNNIQNYMIPLRLDFEIKNIEIERSLKFKSYRDLSESNPCEIPGVLLRDRHNYFYNFYPHIKEGALAILRIKNYESSKNQLYDALEAMKITAKTEILPNIIASNDPLLFITLNCDYEVAFAGTESEIYLNMVDYFLIMLK